MTEKEKKIDSYFSRIVEQLDISDSMRDKAIRSYTAVGDWLGNCDVNSDIVIMPQGSFYLGTIIKPVSDNDEYDIDLVCLLKDANGKTEAEIKHIVGDRLKEHGTYGKMLQPEGKRCWTLNYDEFHMDILPCVPNEITYLEPYLTELKLTHKTDDGKYIPKYSNPYKYHEWFENRMSIKAIEVRKIYSEKNQVEIEKVPLYELKTPLQRAIQLLKRHRDIMYDKLTERERNNAPISIIITTLAAKAYNNEDSVFDALKNILENMGKYIVIDNGVYKILNPVMEQENFAEKWNETHEKAKEFYRWLSTAKAELIDDLITSQGIHTVSNKLSNCFGDNVVRRIIKEEGQAIKAARENKSLYINGLSGGISTIAVAGSKKVGGHTFFGKE